MINILKRTAVLLLPIASLCALAHGQDIPAVTGPSSSQGFSLPDTAGTLRFSLTGTEGVRTGYAQTGSEIWTTAISGDVAYLSANTLRPFSVIYSGGYLYNTAEPSSPFQNLQLSQSIIGEFWTFGLSDSVNYLPEVASGGLSGIPGLGDNGINPPPIDPDAGPGLISNYAQRVSNTVNGHVERKLTGSTSLEGSGTYFITRYLDTTGGLNINQTSGEGGVNHRINAISDIGGSYSYSRFIYPDVPDFSFNTQSVNFHYSRRLKRRLKISVSGGPQFSNTAPISIGTFVQPGNSSITFAGGVGANYEADLTSYSVNYSRGIRGGSGVVPGTLSDDVIVAATHKFGRSLHISANGTYAHTQTLNILNTAPTTFESFFGNVQASRTITDSLSAYISYGIQKQSSDGAAATVNAFNGLSNIGTIGITYSPRALHVGHK